MENKYIDIFLLIVIVMILSYIAGSVSSCSVKYRVVNTHPASVVTVGAY